jgi:AcrR family transcriptional regulator
LGNRSGRPRDTRIDNSVLTATIELLEDVGYADLTLEAIATRAGTTKPAIRRRWPSRQHLVVDALAHTMGTDPTPDRGCTHCDLIVGIDSLSQAFTGGIAQRALPPLVADLATNPELERSFLNRLFHPRRASTAEAIRRGIDRGDLKPEVNIDLLLDMLAAVTYYRLLYRHLPVTADLSEQIVRMVLTGAATEHWRWAHRHAHLGMNTA